MFFKNMGIRGIRGVSSGRCGAYPEREKTLAEMWARRHPNGPTNHAEGYG